MTEIIYIAITERNALEFEIGSIKAELQDEDIDFPLTDYCRKSLLIRMAVLDAGLKFIERMIINDLQQISLTEYLTKTATEND